MLQIIKKLFQQFHLRSQKRAVEVKNYPTLTTQDAELLTTLIEESKGNISDGWKKFNQIKK